MYGPSGQVWVDRGTWHTVTSACKGSTRSPAPLGVRCQHCGCSVVGPEQSRRLGPQITSHSSSSSSGCRLASGPLWALCAWLNVLVSR